MKILYALLLGYFVCNIILKLAGLGMYFWWSKNTSKRLKNHKAGKTDKNWIIVPVYKEESSVAKSYQYFTGLIKNSNLNINLIYVGTDRESPNGTLQILKQMPANPQVVILNADKSRHFMAGQINFAIEYLDKIHSDYKIALYNVDSRPDVKSLENNFNLLDKYSVVQQYGDYSNNLPRHSKSIWDFVYLNTFFYQNSWAKQFEIRNTLWNRFFKIFSKFSYVVGHGMFLNRWVLNKTGLLSEVIQNEDMELSIRLHEHKIQIESGVGFSKSDMPLNISDYIRQQAVWARGPMLAFRYISKWKHIPLAMKLFLHYVYWLIEPWLMVGLLLVAGLSGNIYWILSAVLICLVYFICVLVMPNIKLTHDIRNHPIKYGLSCLVFFVIHSFGPIIALKNIVLESMGLKKQNKFKTPKL